MPETTQVIKTLREELGLQTRHCTLLEAQQQALLACDRERFTALQTDYTRLLPQLEAQDAACKAVLMNEQGQSVTLSALKENAPASSRTTLTALESNLRGTLERVQTLARRNQTLIKNELDYFAFTLDLFVEAGRSADTGYGPHRSSGNGRLTGRLFLDRRA